MVEAFAPEIEQALVHPADFKSALQERLARRGAVVRYEVVAEDGPAARPHVRGRGDGRRARRSRAGSGRSKKDAEQAAAAAGARRDAALRAVPMHLRSITLKGFKSFPDRTRLEFSPGVSVIVGPNGSGKSNITDAVLWAMGEQSPLAVRGQSMQDVIFAGAHGVQARSEAEVEVVLDNGDGAVDLPAERGRDHAAGSTARGRASTGSTARAAGSSTCSRSCRTPASARRCTPSSRRAASSRSSPPSRATGGC